mgnify:CR=1 FL=1
MVPASFAVEVTLETLSSLFATVYMRAWYRLMGARMGQGAEISTNLGGRYDLADIGAVEGPDELRREFAALDVGIY